MGRPARVLVPEMEYESGIVNIYEDQPEIGLTTISYEPTVNEWNLDVGAGEKSVTIPTIAFRKALKGYGNGPADSL